MEKESPKPAKMRFYEVCRMHHLDDQAMQEIADKAGFPKHVVDDMSASVAVRRWHATSVLAALSERTGETWTLSNVKVVVLPTFADLHSLHQFDLAILSTARGVSFDLIGMLLRDEAVSTREARAILQAASQQTRHHYTLNNVDVKLTEGKKKQEKMWYTVEEAMNSFHLKEPVFWRTITLFNIGTRTLPGMKGVYLSKRDFLFLQQRIHTDEQEIAKGEEGK